MFLYSNVSINSILLLKQISESLGLIARANLFVFCISSSARQKVFSICLLIFNWISIYCYNCYPDIETGCMSSYCIIDCIPCHIAVWGIFIFRFILWMLYLFNLVYSGITTQSSIKSFVQFSTHSVFILSKGMTRIFHRSSRA